jgi:hypothetical protein
MESRQRDKLNEWRLCALGIIIWILFWAGCGKLGSQNLVTTNWYQGCGFNSQQPPDENGACDRTLVSSSALCMGQLMNYYQHPNHGWGENNYYSNYGWQYRDFEHWIKWAELNIPELLTDIEAATSVLYSPYFYNYSCGVTTLDTVARALNEHYGYTLGEVNYYPTNWDITNELYSGRPVIMESWPWNNQCSRFLLIDGYDSITGRFHFNAGLWLDHNGWWPIDSIVFAPGVVFGMLNSILTGIEPDYMDVNIDLNYWTTGTPVDANIAFGIETFSTDSGGLSVQVPKGWYYILPDITTDCAHVNSTDAMLIAKHFVGLIELDSINQVTGDVNNSGVINSVDALYVQKKFVHLIPNFICGNWIYQTILINKEGTYTIKCKERGDVN